MRLFAIGDTHLPSARKLDMERFGWIGHPEPLREAWDEKVAPQDVVVVAGDISWATKPHEVLPDLAWLDARPGRKVLVKGNHDFWWGNSAAGLRRLLEPYRSFVGALHNCAVEVGPWLIAGSRLWTTPEAPPMPGGEMGDEAAQPGYVERETRRLHVSIDDARQREARVGPKVRICAVHFPPRYSNGLETTFSKVIEGWQPKVCVYGHLHGPGIKAGFVGSENGVRYVLASCDAAGFSPVMIDEVEQKRDDPACLPVEA